MKSPSIVAALLWVMVGPALVMTAGFAPPSTKTRRLVRPSSSSSAMQQQEQDFESSSEMNRRSLLAGVSSLVSVAVATTLPAWAISKDLKEEYRQGTAALADVDSMGPVPREAYKKLESGVITADLFKGKGSDEVKQGSKVNMEWVLRKSNGYFVDSSEVVGTPFIFTVGDGSAIAGVDEGIRGMVQGGVRRLIIPPKLAYVDGLEDGKPGPLPVGFGPRQQMKRVQLQADVPGQYIYLEVQVTRVR